MRLVEQNVSSSRVAGKRRSVLAANKGWGQAEQVIEYTPSKRGKR